jgi:DNA-binding HxlR family transcriptional regulator
MEADGLLTRQVDTGTPVRVEYHLTEMGRDLAPVIDAVLAWSHKWIPVPAGGDPD